MIENETDGWGLMRAHTHTHRNVATIDSLEDFLDTIHTHLDELWRLPFNYPQKRMRDLMDIICEYFAPFFCLTTGAVALSLLPAIWWPTNRPFSRPAMWWCCAICIASQVITSEWADAQVGNVPKASGHWLNEPCTPAKYAR